MALGVSVRQIRREVAAGRLPCTLSICSPGGRMRRRFSVTDIEAYLRVYCREADLAAVLAALRKSLAA